MRRFLLAAAAATLALSFAPSTASAETFAVGAIYNYSPVAGPKGQVISVNGTCYQGSATQQAVQVTVSLNFPVRSDALQPPIDLKVVTTEADGKFATSLTNNIATTLQFPGEDPIDLEVVVSCSGVTTKRPFASTDRVTNAASTIFTVPGAGPCGFGLAPTEEEAAIPCNAHLKGTDANGSVNNINDYVFTSSDGQRMRGGSVAAGDFLAASGPEIAVATGPGVDLNISSGNPGIGLIHALAPFPGFKAGVSLAFADVTGDARDELIIGAGPGGGPHVKVFTHTGEAWDQVASFYAYGEGFHGGVNVGGADINGDGKAEIITGAGPGAAPHVRIFNAQGQSISPGFYAYGENFHGGVQVAGGNLTEATGEEIVTAPGPGGGPHVQIFSGITPVGPGFYAYGSNFAGGINVAVGNADGGQGNEIVTAPISGGDPHVRVFTDTAGGYSSGGFYAYTRVNHGVKVAVAP